MKDAAPSATALAVSLMRAVHTRTAPLPLINDPWGDQLIPEPAIATIRQSVAQRAASDPGGAEDTGTPPDVDALLRASPAYANVILRSRYTEDALNQAVARGITQYVLIGAGFDSYALRVPDDARHLKIFEIDHPATQAMKTKRLAECGLALSDSVHFLAADLSRESLDAVLGGSAFSSTERSFFSLLGVTMYLTPEENKATMREIAKCGSPGSELVFTYVDQMLFSASAEPVAIGFQAMQQQTTSLGEPFKSGFDPATLGKTLFSVGLQLEEDLGDTQLIERYDSRGVNGLQSVAASRIARACIANTAA